ncbi:stage III sporulation protein AF [Heliomicrobium modesticaldum]|uniref:stage III sporulation protein AF n=1 Tax=Heliomicrobium modesticaldum TaxID=35701 RepID=UPI000310E086|nr:stage III sporulation protein AF [Heliomicrobium modesticaldum]
MIILVGTLLDMLLPNGRLQSLVRLVAGLFIMVAVLNPIMSWLNRNDWAATLGGDMPAREVAGYDEIRRKGEALREEGLHQAREEAKNRLQRQVEALVGLKPGVKAAAAQVELGKREENPSAIGQITVTLRPDEPAKGSKEATEAVAPVMVDDRDLQKGAGDLANDPKAAPAQKGEIDREATAQSIVQTLSGFYGIPPERIRVFWE